MASRQSALTTVFLVVLIDLVGFGIVLPLLPFYAAKYGASPVAIGLLYSIYSAAQLVFSPFWGNLSDKFGRKPILILSTTGALLSYVLFALSHSFALIFISRLLAGAMGGNISTAQAYVADVTSHEDRAKGMGLIGAAFGIGFALGPTIAALLIGGHVDERYAYPGFFAAGLSFISLCLIIFALPESRQKASADDTARVVKTGIFTKDFWAPIFQKKYMLPLLASMAFLSMAHSSLYSAFPLYCHDALGMDARSVGALFAYIGFLAVFIQGGLIRPLVSKFGEKKLFFAGSVVMAAGFFGIPFASEKTHLYFFLTLLAVGSSLNGPTLTSLISKTSGPAEMGKTLGASQSLSALGRVIGPTWGGWLFATGTFLPFVLTSFIVSITAGIGWRLLKR